MFLPVSCSKRSRQPLKNKTDVAHIILISMDTTRADHLACYEHPFIQTPNIDALAQEGMLFEQHISAASSTLTSFTSLMTGTYPHTHGVPRNGFLVDDKNIMLAESLKKAGFMTAGFIGATVLDAEFNFDQGFDTYNADYDFSVKMAMADRAQRRAESVTDSVLRWLEQRSSSATKENGRKQRLFLFVHYFDPHLPYDAPLPFGRMYRKKGTSFDSSMEAARQARELLAKTNSQDAQEVANAYHAEYCAEITYCDYHIGRLLEGLKKHGIFDKALIILTGDHGETINEHFNKIQHGRSVYDTEIRTPLIIRFPAGQFRGRRISRLVSNIDIVPTINHLLGLQDNEYIEGQSFAGLIDGPLGPRSPVFSEATQPWWNSRFDNDPLWPNRGKYQCIRTLRHKYMFRLPDRKFGFYDLQNDPMEQNNLLRSIPVSEADIVESLRSELEDWRNDVRLIALPKQLDSEKATQMLRSLGYVR
ncbi:MAG: hypothetical protein AMJ43_06880 [Coxiella sp. DG_40]|nr:MAG: hypothetical protein AMJ43_06880 [Coxiella sp. DG_40]